MRTKYRFSYKNLKWKRTVKLHFGEFIIHLIANRFQITTPTLDTLHFWLYFRSTYFIKALIFHVIFPGCDLKFDTHFAFEYIQINQLEYFPKVDVYKCANADVDVLYVRVGVGVNAALSVDRRRGRTSSSLNRERWLQ